MIDQNILFKTDLYDSSGVYFTMGQGVVLQQFFHQTDPDSVIRTLEEDLNEACRRIQNTSISSDLKKAFPWNPEKKKKCQVIICFGDGITVSEPSKDAGKFTERELSDDIRKLDHDIRFRPGQVLESYKGVIEDPLTPLLHVLKLLSVLISGDYDEKSLSHMIKEDMPELQGILKNLRGWPDFIVAKLREMAKGWRFLPSLVERMNHIADEVGALYGMYNYRYLTDKYGSYDDEKKTICLYLENIQNRPECQDETSLLTLLSSVLLHEFTHYLHHTYLQYYAKSHPEERHRTPRSRDGKIRKSAVEETIAESMQYAQAKQWSEDSRKAGKTAADFINHRSQESQFPEWGYAGVQYVQAFAEHYQADPTAIAMRLCELSGKGWQKAYDTIIALDDLKDL